MTKLFAAAVLVLALTGCGGPLEDDGTDATGATRQAVLKPEAPKTPAPEVIKVLRDRQADLVMIPAFQEQMHLTNPFQGGCNR